MAGAKKKKNIDPISERARALNEQISTLEAEIKKIDSQLQRPLAPKFKSTAIPHGGTIFRKSEPPTPASKSAASEPVFEEIKKLAPTAEPGTPEHYNELGVRKYDLPALWKRIRNHFRSPTTSNPRLVNYLAAGGVQGLRPLRYEKRVARNRLIALIVFLLIVLLGIISLIVKRL
jgi:hypothetical protein